MTDLESSTTEGGRIRTGADNFYWVWNITYCSCFEVHLFCYLQLSILRSFNDELGEATTKESGRIRTGANNLHWVWNIPDITYFI